MGIEVKEDWHLMPATVCFVLEVEGKLSLLYTIQIAAAAWEILKKCMWCSHSLSPNSKENRF